MIQPTHTTWPLLAENGNHNLGVKILCLIKNIAQLKHNVRLKIHRNILVDFQRSHNARLHQNYTNKTADALRSRDYQRIGVCKSNKIQIVNGTLQGCRRIRGNSLRDRKIIVRHIC